MNNATLTINGGYQTRTVNTKNGERTIGYQVATFDHPAGSRFRMEYEVRSERDALPVGTVLEWDVGADVKEGRYGPELGRPTTFVKRDAAQLRKAS